MDMENRNRELQKEVIDEFKKDCISSYIEIHEELEKISRKYNELIEAVKEAYVHNQNMHCYQTKGKLHDELNKQTIVLRTAIHNSLDTSS
jgi:hypothetical protein